VQFWQKKVHISFRALTLLFGLCSLQKIDPEMTYYALGRTLNDTLQLAKVHAHICGKRTWYNRWHSFGMIKAMFVEPLLFFSPHPLNNVASFSITVAIQRMVCRV